MLKFVQRQPQNAQVDDSITSISVAIELLPEVSSGPIDIVCPPTKPKKRHSHQIHWAKKYSWLLYVKEKDQVFCSNFYLLFTHGLGVDHRLPYFSGKMQKLYAYGSSYTIKTQCWLLTNMSVCVYIYACMS